MNEECFSKRYKRNSREYGQFIDGVIDEYNSNGKPTAVLAIDVFFPIVDGVVNVVDNYAKLFSDFNVLVVAPSYKGEVYVREYPVLGVKAAYSKALAYQVPLVDKKSKKALKKLKIDVVHCHSPFFVGRYLKNLAKKRGIPLISTFHSQFKRDFKKFAGPLTPLLMKFIMTTFNASDEVWTMHTASRDTIISYGYRGKVRLLPNGTSLQPSADYEKERADGRKKYEAGDKLLFIFVGRLVSQKNVFFLADVLKKLDERGLDYKMLFVGDGPDGEKLEKKILSDGVSPRVNFVGRISSREEIAEIYAAADGFLFPSLYDVSSLVQIEAASRYTPTFFAENSVTSCTVTDGVDGYILPLDADKFADGVIAATGDKEGLLRVALNAYKNLYVTWEQIVKRVEDGYRDVIQNFKK